jgi:hypothetical protein
MKKYRFVFYLILSAALLLATSQAFASPSLQGNNTPGPKTPGAPATEKAKPQDDKPKGKRENFKGTISAVGADSLTLTLRDGSSATVSLTTETRIKFPGPKHSAPTSLEPGMNVMVQAIRDPSENLVARSVMVIPGKPTKVHRVGAVTAYTAGASITIQDKDGNSHTFLLDGEIKILPPHRAGTLGVGSRVTIIASRDPASGGVTVKGIVVHPPKP